VDYEELSERIQCLTYLVSDESEEKTLLENELIKLLELRKSFPEYQEEKRKTDFLLYLTRLERKVI